MMLIGAFIDKLFAEAEKRGIAEYQAVYSESESFDLQLFRQKIDRQSGSRSCGLTFAVRINGKIGRFYSQCFAERDIPLIVSEAAGNAANMECEENFFFYDGHGAYETVRPYCPDTERLGRLDKVAFLAELEKKAYAADSRVSNVVSVSYHERFSRRIMRNSLGLDLQAERKTARAGLWLSATDGHSVKSGGYAVMFDKPEDFETDTIVSRAVGDAVSRLNAEDIVSGKMPVVFKNTAFADFIEAISGIFCAYEADSDKSRLKGKIGMPVASPKLTLIDDPLLDGGYATAAFDDEGVPAKYKEIIKDGVLKTFLFGLSMADKYKCASTGNGTGGLASRIFNYYVKPGDKDADRLFEEMGSGICVDRLNGLGVAVDTVSGNLSVAAEGFLVRDGKKAAALNQFTIACNIYDVLKNIREVGNDLIFYCSNSGSPSVLVDEVTVAGA